MTLILFDRTVAMRFPIEFGVDILTPDYALLWCCLNYEESELRVVLSSIEVKCWPSSPVAVRTWTTLRTIENKDPDFVPISREEELEYTKIEELWMHYIDNMEGIHGILSIPPGRDSHEVLKWGLEQGLLPDQDFLVYAKRPKYTHSSYDLDWDIETEAYVVAAMSPETYCRDLEEILDLLALTPG